MNFYKILLGTLALPLTMAFPTEIRAGETALYEKGPVQLDSGLILGMSSAISKDIFVFKGIPYAQAPVGELRWKPPLPVKP